MVDDKDPYLSGLYREASREQPPASVDRAVMELARNSVRKRTLVPFGNHWVAAGALAGICVVSVLLVLLLPEQAGVLDLPQPLQDADAPVSETEMQSRQLKRAADAAVGDMEENADARPEPAGARFDFYSTMPGAMREMPTEGRGIIPASPPQVETGQVVNYVLQIGGFRDLEEAEAMQDKLNFMRLDSRIRQDDATQAGYLVLVGPYKDLNELGRVEALLGKRGIKTTREQVP